MNGMALCAGIGGIELGLQLLYGNAYKTRCYVEREAYPAACLIKRMQEGLLCEAPVWSDLKTFDGRPWYNKIHILTGGYPCQPFSVAGKQGAEADERHLWPEILRVIKEIAPPILFFENVENHINLGLIEVRKSLRELGYRVKAGLFSAEEVGATHRRKRLFILAYRNDQEYDWRHHAQKLISKFAVGHTNRSGLEGWNEPFSESPHEFYAWPPGPTEHGLWRNILRYLPEVAPATEPDFRRVAHGFSDPLEPSRHRTNRIRALGNAVIPLVAAYAFVTLLND